MMIELEEIGKLYHNEIEKTCSNGEPLLANELPNLSKRLFEQIKVEEISDVDNKDCDMLLFQYGVYNWNDEIGEHFGLDITRQFINPSEDEPYQLSITLIYDTFLFKEVDSFDCWSSDFHDMDTFFRYLKNTEGFRLAEKLIPKMHQLDFSYC